MATSTLVLTPQLLRQIEVRNHPIWTKACLAASDAFSLSASVGLAIAAKSAIEDGVHTADYLTMWPFLLVFLMVYAASGLYSLVALGAAEELRRGTLVSSVLFLILGAATVSFRNAEHKFTWTLFLALILNVALMPLARACVRQLCADRAWWGYPAVIFGSGATGERILKAMRNDLSLSLKPVAFIDESADRAHVLGVPVFGDYAFAQSLIPSGRNAYAVFADHDLPEGDRLKLMDRYHAEFSHMLVIPDLHDLSALRANSKCVGGMLGLEIGHTQGQEIVKRAVDLTLAIAFGLAAAPLCALILLAAKFDSPGPIFYGQRRIGRNGRPFKAWKFRSMVTNSQEMLEAHLRGNPEARDEWERSHKLKNDPRVTRIGKFLRKTSLDELPQIWNVFKGEMSFVGPRPIVESEVKHYGDRFPLYTAVKGGITGLWQVSGRSDTTYEERVTLDSFYSRNWSVWLDLTILCRTFSVVLFGKGAY